MISLVLLACGPSVTEVDLTEPWTTLALPIIGLPPEAAASVVRSDPSVLEIIWTKGVPDAASFEEALDATSWGRVRPWTDGARGPWSQWFRDGEQLLMSQDRSRAYPDSPRLAFGIELLPIDAPWPMAETAPWSTVTQLSPEDAFQSSHHCSAEEGGPELHLVKGEWSMEGATMHVTVAATEEAPEKHYAFADATVWEQAGHQRLVHLGGVLHCDAVDGGPERVIFVSAPDTAMQALIGRVAGRGLTDTLPAGTAPWKLPRQPVMVLPGRPTAAADGVVEIRYRHDSDLALAEVLGDELKRDLGLIPSVRHDPGTRGDLELRAGS